MSPKESKTLMGGKNFSVPDHEPDCAVSAI